MPVPRSAESRGPNLSPHDRDLYDGDLAHARARERARRLRRTRLAQDTRLRDEVQAKLELRRRENRSFSMVLDKSVRLGIRRQVRIMALKPT